jgi:hypothetical protein
MSVRGAIATAVVALAVPAAGAAAPVPTTVYRGSAHGVTCVLRASTLTITFGPDTDALLRRAARSRYTMEFLMWPPPAKANPTGWGTSWFAESVQVDVHKREARLRLTETPVSRAFLCGLHEPVKTTKGPAKASNYLTKPIVVVRLTPAG